jgi:hypothetical protein
VKLRLTAAVLFLVLALGTAIGCGIHLDRLSEKMSAQLEEAIAACVQKAPDWAEQTDAVTKTWEKNKGFLHVMLPHQNINELEWAITSLKSYCDKREATLYLEQCVRALGCVATIVELEKPNFGNIF